MKFSIQEQEKIMERIIKACDLCDVNGIVTKLDIGSMNTNNFLKELEVYIIDQLEENDKFNKYLVINIQSKDKTDWSGAIFRTDMLTHKEAEDFIRKNVFKE